MILEEEYTLSFYKEIAKLDEEHCVALVQHTQNHKIFVKKILSVFDADIYRFLKEHPIENIPRIFEVVEQKQKLIVIEEYVTGTSLQETLEREGTLPKERVISITDQLCKILADLHGMEPPIIHRDIKPSNIIVQPDGTIKLLDMNAAKWADENEERDTMLIGTHGYAAPEQYGFGSSGPQTDIYALGILMNTMITGEVSRHHIPENWLGDVIRRCTAMDPEARYQDAMQVREALSRGPGEDTERRGKWKRFLPPGFRNLHPWSMLLSTLGYLFLFLVGFSLTVKDAGQVELWINRAFFTLMMVSAVLFSGNYLGIQDRLHISQIQNRALRVLAIIGTDILIMAVCLTMLALLELFF